MDVQFSLSAHPVSPIKSVVSSELGFKGGNADSRADQINTNLELNQAERQGVKVPIGEEQLIKAIDKAVKALEGPSTTLEISIHEKTHELMVKVLNKDTGELIREVPPEKTLDLVAKMMEIAGILIDERV
ncbi:flagellar protein FlaG [Paenibacillus spiritus]|uniref:Flagellar protein FlaG n=1 Tax=Paenibacillus spiritus TaxID=2496557 RepID=A0A5J5FWI1_9BACL|nr:flagellar protein FlaG [Paenibacillus spiritus]KAA8997980.1 flagellar protein FlaG [Paenibacillus spiritus]